MKLNEQQQSELRQRMADAASLPTHDPQRLAVVREVVAAGAWAEREWLEMITADERIRMDLQRVDAPATLTARLMQLPDEAPDDTERDTVGAIGEIGDGADAGIGAPPGGAHSPWRMHDGGSGWVRVAAVVLIAVGVWMGLRSTLGPGAATGPNVDTQLHTLALLALDHHMLRHPMHIFADGRDAMQHTLAGRVPYKVHVPDLGDGYTLEGAAICKLGGHDVVCTRWRSGDRSYTLFQYCTTDFDLPKRITRQTVNIARPWHEGNVEAPREVEFWTRGDCAYALLVDPPPVDTPPPAAPPPPRAH